MSNENHFVYSSKNAFSSGELTPTMEGRSDLPIYAHGVKKLINFMILPSGGIKRRHGTEYVHHFDEKQPPTRSMLNMIYSRSFSFLVIFTAKAEKLTQVEVMINGEGTPVILGNLPIQLKSNNFSYVSYQGVAYISFGLEYPIYQFSIDISEVKKLETIKEWNEADRKKLFICKVFETKGTIYQGENQAQNQLYHNLITQDANQVNNALKNAAKAKIIVLHASSINVFEGRLWALGTGRNIHEIWSSKLGSMDEFNLAYESLLEARSPLSAFSATFISSTFDKILWSIPFAKELLIGSSDGIYVLKTGDRTKDEFVSINKDIEMSISKIMPVICGKTIFFVGGDNKQIHSLYYSQEKGGYQVSCITTYAEHLFVSGIKQIVAVNTPFNIIFAIMNNGSFASFTYSEDLKIMGWSQHWLGGDAKILEAVILPSKNSEQIYFRSIREGKTKDVATREYIERFDCKYLTASSTATPHIPLYVDCYMHDLNEDQKIIDKDFDKLTQLGTSFDFKGDISHLDELIEKQIAFETSVNLDDIGNYFFLGGIKINDLDNEKDGLSQIWIDFIRSFFNNYRKVILLSYGLWIAIIRGLNKFCALLLKFLLTNQSNSDELDASINDIARILKEFHAQQEKIISWKIGQDILVSTKEITHVNDGRYAFFPSIMDSVKGENYSRRFIDLIGKLKLAKEIAICSTCYPDEYKQKAKKDLLKKFIFKANSNWLNININLSVENLDFNELAYKLANSHDKNAKYLLEFNKESILFAAQNTILDVISENLFKKFCIYFNLDQDLSGYQTKTFAIKHLNAFFKRQICLIIAIIYNSFDLSNVDIQEIKATACEGLNKFLKICLIIRQDIRDQINIEKLTDEVFDAYMARDAETLQLVERYRIRFKAESIISGLSDLEDNTEIIKKQPNELQDTLKRRNDDMQYETAISMIGLDNIRDADDEDIEFDEEQQFADGGEYHYLSDDVKHAIIEKVKQYNNKDCNANAFLKFDNAIKDNQLNLNIDDFIYSGLESYINELADPNITGTLLDSLRRIKDELKIGSSNSVNEFFDIVYTQINITYRNIQDHYLSLIRYANLTVPTENIEFVSAWQDQVNPSKIDKFLFLAREYFPIFRENFPDIDASMLKVITREVSASKNSVSNREMYQAYYGMNVSFVGDEELVKEKTISKNAANIVAEVFKDHFRFMSIGFNYKSVLKTFPLVFPEETQHLMKKDAGVHLKLFNTKGGYIEEKVSESGVQKQFIHTPKVDFDIINNYLPDKKYLMAETINSIKTPYLSGWLYFACNRPVDKDIDLTYVVDKPYPATILKIDAKAKIFPHYLN